MKGNAQVVSVSIRFSQEYRDKSVFHPRQMFRTGLRKLRRSMGESIGNEARG